MGRILMQAVFWAILVGQTAGIGFIAYKLDQLVQIEAASLQLGIWDAQKAGLGV